MFGPPAPPSGPLLADDTPCRRCGYNLRSLSRCGKCPECATPVEFSVRGDLLQYADPAWVLTLARGATAIVYAIAAAILAFIAVIVFSMLNQRIDWLLLAVGTPAAVALLVGQWLITQPDPSSAVIEERTTSRQVVRWLLLAVLVLSASKTIARLTPIMSHPGVDTTLGLVNRALAACWMIAYSQHLAGLFDRIPDAKRAPKCRRIGPILAGLLIVAAFKKFISLPPPGALAGQSRLTDFFELFFGLVYLALLIYATRALALNSTLAKLLRIEARKAEANWSPAKDRR